MIILFVSYAIKQCLDLLFERKRVVIKVFFFFKSLKDNHLLVSKMIIPLYDCRISLVGAKSWQITSVSFN